MLLGRTTLAIAAASFPALLFAQNDTTRASLERAEEVLAMRAAEGVVRLADIVPIIVVSTAVTYEESRTWFPAAALASLTRVFGASTLRFCEACMAPRTFVAEGRLEQYVGALTTDEILRLDETARGNSQPARTAVWLDETVGGVALRLVDLRTSRLVLAENIDPAMKESARSEEAVALVRELDRRARGDAITQVFMDTALYPAFRWSLDWTEQWGETNRNLSGVSMSLFDPILGIGGAYYRVIPEAWNLMLGGQILMSLPTAIVRSISGEDFDIIDPLITGVLMLRVPIVSSNYGVTLSISTNGSGGIGLSLMNISFLPVLP